LLGEENEFSQGLYAYTKNICDGFFVMVGSHENDHGDLMA
jgi:hypothetical protein